ncbi:cytochrome b subunit of succinate dehydrogenase, Sdh3p [Steccherinum ochraceum]|uniref:Cytochrome b subunit of succinate dehydrogenase, Sdh3p n=1 Tax=Steccherinum ochraceum TaxID=92696 RepID=A0A4R0RED7_9APHY|nr:cytochrome b subunit of succinate dehydrogenase, Sdh3p [Steccherinum ochraceum]
MSVTVTVTEAVTPLHPTADEIRTSPNASSPPSTPPCPSERALGLGPALRQAAFAPRFAARSALVKRSIQTQSLPPSAAVEILNKQRLHRPSSPHYTIYQPQLTWVPSIAHRFTGTGLSILLYGYAIAYLVAPETFSSAQVVELVSTLPDAVKIAGKTILAAPFAFHSFNGIRHLTWDMLKFVNLKGAYTTVYAVFGATTVATIALVMW